jgi:HSP20 family protein
VITIARWTPFRELDAIERRMRRTLEAIGFVSALLPAADVYETADEFVVELEVPGYEEKELSIEISDHTLKISGERTETKEAAEKTYQLRGRLERQFDRRFELPPETDTGRIKAVFQKGVLEVRAPKRQTAKAHKLEISKPARSEPST